MNVNMILDMMSLPIFGHINPSHNSHFGVASHIMVLNVGDFPAHENQEKCGSVVRVELEKINWLNSNGQNKIYLAFIRMSIVNLVVQRTAAPKTGGEFSHFGYYSHSPFDFFVSEHTFQS